MGGEYGKGVSRTGSRSSSGDVTSVARPVRISAFGVVTGAAASSAALHVFGGGGSSLWTLRGGVDGSASVSFPDGLYISSGLHIVIGGTATAFVAYDEFAAP